MLVTQNPLGCFIRAAAYPTLQSSGRDRFGHSVQCSSSCSAGAKPDTTQLTCVTPCNCQNPFQDRQFMLLERRSQGALHEMT